MFKKFKAKKELQENIALVKASKYFDANWYLDTNPDVMSLNKDPAEHYLKHGWLESRLPSSNFDPVQYAKEHPDCHICPVLHYELSQHQTKQEKAQKKMSDYDLCKASKYFDAKWYLKSYPAVKKAKMDPISHYLKFGWKEGRNPSKLFDTKWYLAAYPNVAKAKMNPLVHFLKYGLRENRLPLPPNKKIPEGITKSQAHKIAKSKFFDKEWYITSYPEVVKTKIDPALHYLTVGWKKGYNPSLNFDTNFYLTQYPDVSRSKTCPLWHYIRFGEKERRSALPPNAPHFPNSAHDIIWQRPNYNPKNITRLAIFASYSSNGKIADYVVHYLKGLKEVCDAIIFVASSPLIPTELNKIKKFVVYAEAKVHNEYDFGSYKRGYQWAANNKLLNKTKELVLCNDSCYAPIYPLHDMFHTMINRHLDMWGVSDSKEIAYHIQSYFMVFNPRVFTHPAFEQFLNNVQAEANFHEVVRKYEVGISQLVQNAGFSLGAYLSHDQQNVTQYPLTMLDQKAPMIKRKLFKLYNFCHDDPIAVIKAVQKINPTIYQFIKEDSIYHNFTRTKVVKNPKISVLVASYNYEDYIKETLDSLVNQTYQNFEVIVVDDGSKDNSEKVIRKYCKKYPNIRLYRHKQGKNKGLAATVRLALSKATGDYIAFCESDDLWAENHLEDKVKLIQNYKDVNIIVNDILPFGNKTRITQVAETLAKSTNLFAKSIRRKFSLIEAEKMNIIHTLSSFMVSKKVLDALDLHPMYRESLLDRWIYRQALVDNAVWFVPVKLTKWRLHTESYTTKVIMEREALTQKYENALNTLLMKQHPFQTLPLKWYLFQKTHERKRHHKSKRLLFYIEPHPIRNDMRRFINIIEYIEKLEKTRTDKKLEIKIYANLETMEMARRRYPSLKNYLSPLAKEQRTFAKHFVEWDPEGIEKWVSLAHKSELFSEYCDLICGIYHRWPFDYILNWGTNEAVRYTAKQLGVGYIDMELGCSRKPFLDSVVFDPWGVNGASSMSKADISDFASISKEDEVQMSKHIPDDGPLPANIANKIKKFSGVAFIPLQLYDDANMLLYASYKEVQDVLKDILPKLARKNFLCIIKEHPASGIRKGSLEANNTAKKYASSFKNILWLDTENSSQVTNSQLYKASDVIITVNSSTGFEALYYDKPVVVLGEAVYKPTNMFPTLDEFLKHKFDTKAYIEHGNQIKNFFCQYYLVNAEEAFKYPFFSKYIQFIGDMSKQNLTTQQIVERFKAHNKKVLKFNKLKG